MNNSSNMFKKLETEFIGKKCYFYKEIDSTQKEIWRLVEKNEIENGTIVIAELQTNGVGTHERVWYKKNKDNISFSICLVLNTTIDKLDNFTYEIAEILVKIFKTKYNIKIDIKKPNDLMINDKKIGGILTETRIYGNNVKYVVIGIGINTNSKEEEKEIKDISTSINNEFNIKINNGEIICEFCNLLEKNIKKRIGDLI